MKKALLSIFVVFFFLFMPLAETGAWALTVTTAKKCPLYLVADVKNGVIAQAHLGTPAGSYPIKTIEGYLLSRHEIFTLKNKGESPRYLWRLHFVKGDSSNETMQLWIAYLPNERIIEVASGKTINNDWTRIVSKLPLPEGVFLFPSYDPLAEEQALPCVFTIILSQKGLSFAPMPKVYEQIIPLAITFAQSKGIFEQEKVQRTIGIFTQLAQGENADNIAKTLSLKKDFKITW